jgi:hypothetical protein
MKLKILLIFLSVFLFCALIGLFYYDYQNKIFSLEQRKINLKNEKFIIRQNFRNTTQAYDFNIKNVAISTNGGEINMPILYDKKHGFSYRLIVRSDKIVWVPIEWIGSDKIKYPPKLEIKTPLLKEIIKTDKKETYL